MSGASSSAAEWHSRLEPAQSAGDPLERSDDPRLASQIEPWQSDEQAIRPGRPVLIGFPCDLGVKRNQGRTGAAVAPREIRGKLGRLTPWDCETGLALPSLLDLGDVRRGESLETAQAYLGQVVAEVLRRKGVPIVLGGGHETAYGHYLGYAACRLPVGVINIDAHLDVRPRPPEGGNSGTPFRQMIEDANWPLPDQRYACLGVQPFATSRDHWQYAHRHGVIIRSCREVAEAPVSILARIIDQLAKDARPVYLSIDADVVRAADVPGVSAPNPCGLSGAAIIECARLAGARAEVSSLDLVEINPTYDRDGQSTRWAAVVIWNFLAGLGMRANR